MNQKSQYEVIREIIFRHLYRNTWEMHHKAHGGEAARGPLDFLSWPFLVPLVLSVWALSYITNIIMSIIYGCFIAAASHELCMLLLRRSSATAASRALAPDSNERMPSGDNLHDRIVKESNETAARLLDILSAGNVHVKDGDQADTKMVWSGEKNKLGIPDPGKLVIIQDRAFDDIAEHPDLQEVLTSSHKPTAIKTQSESRDRPSVL